MARSKVKVTVEQEEALEEEDLTSCGICLSVIEQPKSLPCLHTYCFKCLSELAKHEDTTVTCPVCHKVCTLPADGVSGLENNTFVTKLKERKAVHMKLADKECKISCTSCEGSEPAAVARCVECDDFLCAHCFQSHKTMRLLKNHHTFTLDELRTRKADPVEKIDYCKKHTDQILWIFCETCGTLICRDCTVFDHCKPEHTFVDLQSATEGQREKINQLAGECKKLALLVDEGIDSDGQVISKLDMSVKTALAELSKSYQQKKSSFLTHLDANYNKVVADIEELKAKARQEIEAHTDDLRIIRSRLRNTLSMASQLTQTGSDGDVAQMYASVTVSLQQLRDVRQPPLQKRRVEGVIFKENKETDLSVELGSVSPETKEVSNKRDCWKFERQVDCGKVTKYISNIAVAKGNIHEICFVDALSQIFVSEGCETFKCISNKGSPFGVTVNANGEYFITAANKFVYKFLSNLTEAPLGTFPIVLPDSFERFETLGITVDRKSQLVVGEFIRKCISIRTQNGSRINDFNVSVHPYYLAVNSHDHLAVSCEHSCCTSSVVVDMANSGRVLFTLNAPATCKLWEPKGVCWNKDNDLFVVNSEGDKGIYQYSSSGDYKSCVIHGLEDPHGLTITDDDEKLLVADGKCIKIYCLK